MKASASQVRKAYSSLRKSDYPSVDDCGSQLVAETLAMFVDQMSEGIMRSKLYSGKLADDIDGTADDFVTAEDANQQSIRQLFDSLKVPY